jgi:hypothetical protein
MLCVRVIEAACVEPSLQIYNFGYSVFQLLLSLPNSESPGKAEKIIRRQTHCTPNAPILNGKNLWGRYGKNVVTLMSELRFK